MMGAIPSLAVDIFQCVVQLMEFYVHCCSTSDRLGGHMKVDDMH